MLGSHAIATQQQRSVTRDARKVLATKIGTKNAREAIRYATADQLNDLGSLGDFDALFVAFGNFCPHCRALTKTLADAAHALVSKRDQKTPVHVVLFETSDEKNREFAVKTLKNKYVPAFFLLHARNGSVWLEKWHNSDKVRSEIGDDDGQMQKVLPIETLLDDLAGGGGAVREGQVSRETMQTYRSAAEARHQAKLAQLNLY